MVKEDSSSIITGEGVYALEVGSNLVTLTVQAENGDIITYELNIIRKKIHSVRRSNWNVRNTCKNLWSRCREG